MTAPDEATTLRAALMRERAAHAQTREALREARARWEAMEAAKATLADGPPGTRNQREAH